MEQQVGCMKRSRFSQQSHDEFCFSYLFIYFFWCLGLNQQGKTGETLQAKQQCAQTEIDRVTVL